jgi:methyl-accepting chemotaxis protein
MKKLDKMTLEEVAMASAQLLKVTHDIRNEVQTVANGVDCVDEAVQDIVAQVGDVKCDIQVVGDQVEVVDERLQAIADGEKVVIFCQRSAHKYLDGKELMATAMETKSILQQAAENLDHVKRS